MFGFNSGRNKVDSYSKNEIDNFFKEANKNISDTNSKIDNLESKVYIKDNYAIIEGNITLTSNTSEHLANNMTIHTNIQINYPSGFNMDNCICLGIILKNNAGDRWSTMSFDASTFAVRSLTGSIPRTATLYNNYIQLSVGNPVTQQMTIPYKLILLKYK